jgi:diguanylate cyclase (GGDEF)-like protein
MVIKPEIKIHQLEKEIQRLKKLVYLDALTNVYNRRGFLELGKNYLKSIHNGKDKRRKNEIADLAVIFLDLDDFKKVNDKYGHDKGDKVLKSFARLLKKSLRSMDLVARWGGEEFVTLLVNVSNDNARKIAQKLCHKISKTRIAGLHLTASLGLSSVKKGQTLMQIIIKADKFMYQAKKRGKNQVVYIK